MNTQLKALTGTFVSPQTEAAYQAFVADSDRMANFRVLLFALPIFPFYAVLDYFTLDDPGHAIVLRLASSMLCLAMFLALRSARTTQIYEWITFAVVVILGVTINGINYLFADLADSYYVGLVQGCVFVCFLLRISFVKTVLAQLTLVFGFIPGAYARPDASEAGIQSVVMVTMIIVCSIGAYLLQRFRRFDFQKVLIIEEQNAKLNELLTEAQRDNERKIAALNMLVHFVKTPLHQITGFSDILVSAMGDSANNESAENARYIKNASVNLTKSINNLLNYHRLDDAESRATPEPIELSCIVDDFSELLPEGVSLSKGEIISGAVMADPEIMRAALDGIADHYREKRTGATRVVLSIESEKGAVVINIRDDAGILSAAQYEDLVQPLTQMQGYLSHTGDEMPMALRTVARAVEISGGDMAHTALADGNRYKLTLPAADENAAAAA